MEELKQQLGINELKSMGFKKFNTDLDYFEIFKKILNIHEDLWSYVIRLNYIDVIQFLNENNFEGCSMRQFESAIYVGNIELAKSFSVNISFDKRHFCNSIHNAVSNDNIEVVKFLHENGYTYKSASIIDNAAKYGNLDIIKYLYENSYIYTHKAMCNAAKKGHIEVVKWLLQN